MCVGDFNEIVEDAEKFGGLKKPRWQMQDFQNSIVNRLLFDLGFSGPKYTWCNKREGPDFMHERLDRALANSEWIDLFPDRSVEVLAGCNSDHMPIFLKLACN